MANSKPDGNSRGTLIALSSAADGSIVNVYADPITHRLLVDSTGGSGTTAYYTPTGTVDSVNTIFGVTGQPSSVVSDGVTYFEGFGYSYSSLQITLDIAPSSYIRYTL